MSILLIIMILFVMFIMYNVKFFFTFLRRSVFFPGTVFCEQRVKSLFTSLSSSHKGHSGTRLDRNISHTCTISYTPPNKSNHNAVLVCVLRFIQWRKKKQRTESGRVKWESFKSITRELVLKQRRTTGIELHAPWEEIFQ